MPRKSPPPTLECALHEAMIVAFAKEIAPESMKRARRQVQTEIDKANVEGKDVRIFAHPEALTGEAARNADTLRDDLAVSNHYGSQQTAKSVGGYTRQFGEGWNKAFGSN